MAIFNYEAIMEFAKKKRLTSPLYHKKKKITLKNCSMT